MLAHGKSLPREENRSRRKERRARELISNTRTRVTCSLRAHDHSPHARPKECSPLFIFVSHGAGLAGLIVTSNVIGYSPFPEVSIGLLV